MRERGKTGGLVHDTNYALAADELIEDDEI